MSDTFAYLARIDYIDAAANHDNVIVLATGVLISMIWMSYPEVVLLLVQVLDARRVAQRFL